MSQDISSNTPNLVSGISEIASAVTTVCATGLITLRIILVTRNSPQRNFYQRIIQIITESTVLSSVILLFVGTLKLTDVRRIFYLRTKLGLGEEIALSYAGAITGPILVRILLLCHMIGLCIAFLGHCDDSHFFPRGRGETSD